MKLLDRIANDPVAYAIRIIVLGVTLFFVLGLLGCATTAQAGPQDDGSFVYHLTPEQVAQCEREGGCSTVTREYELGLVCESAKHFCGVEI